MAAPEENDDQRLTRADVASWISGPGSVRAPTESVQTYPGQRLGLAESGSGSIARAPRRIVAIFIDWFACLLLVRLFLPELVYGSPAAGLATLIFFAAEVALFTWIAGSSFGHRIAGLQVAALASSDGDAAGPRTGPPGLGRAVGRTLLLCLVVPALVWDRDQRGLHDRWMGTVLLRGRPEG